MASECPHPQASLLGLPTELRLKIFAELYDALIEELPDNLFGVFQLYDSMYDYTASHLEAHVGKTELTPVLSTCRQIHQEALTVLSEKATFLVNIMGDDDFDDKERASMRFSDGNRRLAFATDLRVNLLPTDEATMDRFMDRMNSFLNAIGHGTRLRSLEVFLQAQAQGGEASVSAASICRILEALASVKILSARVVVQLGEVDPEHVSDEQVALLLDPTNLLAYPSVPSPLDLLTLCSDYQGRGNWMLEPLDGDYEEETTTVRFACTFGEDSDLSGDESQEDEDEGGFSDEDSNDEEGFPVL
ncbi:hypothetical protein GQ53DRAFT_90097 [Thozetella sp. PMI_491]|nr:hypothetical protein GQ53DRAFT_90097 [Thozetella sp. PMI_491]